MLFADAEIKKILAEIKSIAIIGAKDKEGQPVDRVGRYLIAQGYNVLPVHPKRASVWGIEAYPALGQLPAAPEAVVLFRAAEYCPAHAREALALAQKPRLFWMQLGITSPEAMALVQEYGITAVQNACIMVEHRRLLGKEQCNAGF